METAGSSPLRPPPPVLQRRFPLRRLSQGEGCQFATPSAGWRRSRRVLDVSLGRAFVAETWRLPAVDRGLVKRVVNEFRVEGFVCLGRFRNVRTVREWQGLRLELDETQFDFGTSYEIECESDDPESAKRLLDGFLKENGIPCSFPAVSRCRNLR